MASAILMTVAAVAMPTVTVSSAGWRRPSVNAGIGCCQLTAGTVPDAVDMFVVLAKSAAEASTMTATVKAYS